MDLVDSERLYNLLRNKYVLLCGDSIMRSIYKDIVLLVQGQNRLLTNDELRAKLDDHDMLTLNDQLLAGDKKTNDTSYYERRCYFTNTHLIKFVFLTRCFSSQMRNELREIEENKSIVPDVILLNSAIWDITKYEKNSERDYAQLLEECFRSIRSIIPPQTIVIWLTATPFSKNACGVLDETRSEKKNFLRIRIFDINTFSSQLAKKYNFQVIDLHYLVRKRTQHRCKDGMHYDAIIHREITTHIVRYIECGLNKNLSNSYNDDQDNNLICNDVIKSIINKIDYQITSDDKEILDKYRSSNFNFDMIENLNEKETAVFYLLDHYENNCFQ
ncbi:unnamed protein product [Rotaria socialis]|uniref:Uncharacterized protein n=1 Tax=Rotaria socialis TaxID=392032 RepID=A0A820GL30_9BILA|nr:unnamed protein product [Rotaria socialis]CAF3312056.1 unnamed protein product [Rotaria socialis]CAF3409638.1 unnamed protein product [Rotaria socialis]CAF4281724.1 unnamed protein product [Rotaria socialis]CAF4410218.1 unnamed protein product [Rotaria socialis]